MTPRRLGRPAVAAAFAALWLLSIAPTAFAHAELATMTPADKSTVTAPTEIVATFTQDLDASKSSLTVVDAAGKVVAQGGIVGADKRSLTLALGAAVAPGAYTIRWASWSAEDNEGDRNTTTFTVVAASPSPTVAASVAVTPSAVPSAAPSVAASPSPSAGTPTPASSTSDALIPVVVVLLALALLGLWLLRGRSRRGA